MAHIAVIGAGISGLTTAFLLSPCHQVTLIEANDYLGGHTHTHDIVVGDARVSVDTGFIVYNARTYPNFIALLDELGCRGRKTEMSFSVCNPETGLEYNGHNLNTLFAQRRNLFRPRFFRMLMDITRFNREAREIKGDDERSLGEFLDEENYGSDFCTNYLLPMAAAIWSTGQQDIASFPVCSLAHFFNNHGLLDTRNRPQWYVVEGGSCAYVAAMKSRLGRCLLQSPVENIQRFATHVEIRTKAQTINADQVVVATHSDQALTMLTDPTPAEREVLGSIRYTSNHACLHTDESCLPSRELARASWNYRIDTRQTHEATLTYDMNILQGLDSKTNLLVTLNGADTIDKTRIIKEMNYSHPLFDRAALRAQMRHKEISGKNRTHYAGAYWGYGFHEDGVVSARRVCEQLGADCQ